MPDPALSKLLEDPDGDNVLLKDEATAGAVSALPAAPPPPIPRPAATPSPALAKTKAPEPDAQEVDLWWGSYAARTMMPSILVCIALTGLIAWVAWLNLPRGLVQLTILGSAGAVWLFQTVRWSYRVFGYNYRMTTRRLFSCKGLLVTCVHSVNLADVANVQVRYAGYQKMLGVGKIVVRVDDPTQPLLSLSGVRSPERIAERIREFVQKARANQVTQARVSSV